MRHKYPVKIEKESMAYVAGINLGISSKVSIEISSWLRGKSLTKAKSMLERVIAMEQAVPYRRFNKDVGHKPGIGPGRYPVKASSEFLDLLKSAESNAVDKGINAQDLFIFHISADRAAQQWKYGRQRRRKAKRTHVKIVLKDVEKKAGQGVKKGSEKPIKSMIAKVETPIAEKKEIKKEVITPAQVAPDAGKQPATVKPAGTKKTEPVKEHTQVKEAPVKPAAKQENPAEKKDDQKSQNSSKGADKK